MEPSGDHHICLAFVINASQLGKGQGCVHVRWIALLDRFYKYSAYFLRTKRFLFSTLSDTVLFEGGFVFFVEFLLIGLIQKSYELLCPGVFKVGGAFDDGVQLLFELVSGLLILQKDLVEVICLNSWTELEGQGEVIVLIRGCLDSHATLV